MIKLSDIKIDAYATLGENMLLTDITPAYVYLNGRKTEEVEGFKYTVACQHLNLDKVSIKILGKKQLEMSEKFEKVRFDGLALSVYIREGQPQISAKAEKIAYVNTKT